MTHHPRAWAPHFLLGGGAALWALLALLQALGGPLLPRLEGLFVDSAFRFRLAYGRPPTPDSRIAPLRIDRRSTERFGRWPWPRGFHTELLGGVDTELRPRGVVFDVLFRGPSDPDQDARFAEGLASLDKIGLAVGVGESSVTTRAIDAGAMLQALPDLERHLLPAPPGSLPGPPWVSRLSFPHAPFRKATRGLGHILPSPDPDRVYRRFRPLLRVGDRLVPSLSLLGACMALRLPLGNVTLEGSELVLRPGGELREERRFPLRADGSMWINWVDRYGRGFEPLYAHELKDPVDDDLRRRAEDRLWVLGVATLAVDMGPSPLQKSEIPLFETHLHAINTLVTGQTVREPPWYLAWSLALLAWLPLLLGALRLPPLRGTLLGLVPLVAYPLLGLALFGAWSLLLPFAWPYSFLLGSFAGLQAFYLLVFERDRQRARDSFARFFPDQVVEEILASPEGPHLGGRRADLTMLFSDIQGFTSTSERTDPDLLVSFLGAYFDRMVEIVFRHGGTVDKFMGDGLMAFWGDPVAQEDQADRALRAAREMQQAAREIDAAWSPRLGAPVRIRIGIQSGPVSVGNMGGQRRMEYTVLGRAVNLAQRLESAAPPGGILIGAAAHEQLRDEHPAFTPREIHAKGIEGPVPAYELGPELFEGE